MTKKSLKAQTKQLSTQWTNNRFNGIVRPYSPDDVVRLRPRLQVEHTHAKVLAQKLWKLLNTKPYVKTFGAMIGPQAVQMVREGAQSIYLSGWQVAAGANKSGQVYPDMSLYPVDSAPALVSQLINALQRADEIDASDGHNGVDWYAPIVADAEAGFGGPLHAYELMKSFIKAGAAGVHFEDQLGSAKKCGHLGGKVLRPTSQFINTLVAARLAADVLGVETVLVARTDALDATLLENDVDERDHEFMTGERTPEGFWRVRGGLDSAIKRGLAFAPYADMLWFESSKPDLEQARKFAEAIHAQFPGKLLAYNCSPSFNWRKNLDDKTIMDFQAKLGAMGYKFQFITLAGWHSINLSSWKLAREYMQEGMPAYVRVQEEEFAAQKAGYTAVAHQKEVGTGLFDLILETVTAGQSSTTALAGSTEAGQFHG
ncbi:MAG: isocitrate lyase [Cyanobacteriota bacterium erpe_2018_sw_21hr_WHONDRS-SW48-000092_B_bin.40]|jgi:isocitrate lyase|nr:isocitrate lyase [Cyanobacteriota bacterium erpe_2018_sw_21hr_WHONDRS-SW48-000092_B_bin.40]